MLVFTYGTLMRGLPLSGYLTNSEFIGTTWVTRLSMYSAASYPYIQRSDSAVDAVKGEVYNVSEETLKILDSVENEGSLYRREVIRTLHGDAFVYIGIDEVFEGFDEQIKSGDWREYVSSYSA
jgi:gamma-glutamylcyclotransferase (GGCT)/AIG2-like uncharacterized protein YtfP